jgi:single-strand DNA-binding protein
MPSLFGLAKIGRDVTVRHTANGEPVANVPLAFNYGKKGADGRKPTQWVDATLWGARAESTAPYLLKGTSVSVTVDDVHIETYKANDGTTGTKLVGRIGSMEFAGSPKQSQADPAAAAPAAQPKPTPAAASLADMADDVPF